ncbi:MAG: histidine kinase dimerization/phospho-acceptor domain-containing protein [Luteibacter sp.]
MAVLDDSLAFTWMNPAMAELLHVSAALSLSRRLHDIVRNQLINERAPMVMRDRERCVLRATMLGLPGGGEIQADVIISPNASGGVVIEIFFLSSTAMPALSATLRGLAHEVKNPLMGVRGAAQLLYRRVSADDLRALTELILAETDKLSSLINDILGEADPGEGSR